MLHDKTISQDIINADKFILRPLIEADAGMIELYASDERVAKNTSSIPHPLPPGTTEAFIARAMGPEPEEMVWAMDASADDGPALMGVLGLKCLERDQCEVGYWVAPAFWNTGLASAAVGALIAANPKGSKTYFASVFQDNPASARVLTNHGFDYIGDAEVFSVARGANVPTWTYLRKL